MASEAVRQEGMGADFATESCALSIDGALAAAELDAYRRDGFVVVRGRFPAAEVAEWQAECDRLWAVPELHDQRNLRLESRGHSGGIPVLDRIDPVLDLSPSFEPLVADERIAGALRSIWLDSAICFRCKLVLKRPGTFGYLMHQDYPYWEWMQIPADGLLTVYIAIDAADADNGAIELFAGLHHTRVPGLRDEPRDIDEACMDTTRGCIPQLAPGDFLIMHAGVPHRSAPNRTQRWRRALLPSYAAGRRGDWYGIYDQRRRGLVRAARATETETYFR